MTPEEFRSWRSALGVTQQQAADALGISRSAIELYESGRRRDSDQPVEIPKVVALACAALRRVAGDDPSLEHKIQQWHDAGDVKYKALLNSCGEDGLFNTKNHFQLSYGLAHAEGQEVEPGQLKQVLNEISEEVHDRVHTGWSMFYVFTREEIRPRTTVDPASGKGDDDFLECSLVGLSETEATDYWRVARDGFATVMRGYFEDRPSTAAHLGAERGSFLNPSWLVRDFGELVRHAQAFAARFTDVTSVSFRFACYGLSNRTIYDPSLIWLPSKFDSDAEVRVSTGTWSLSELADKWPTIVSKLAAPVMRAADVAHVITPRWVKERSERWRML